MCMKYLEHFHTKKLFVVYLKFSFNWASCVFSGSPKCGTTEGFSAGNDTVRFTFGKLPEYVGTIQERDRKG